MLYDFGIPAAAGLAARTSPLQRIQQRGSIWEKEKRVRRWGGLGIEGGREGRSLLRNVSRGEPTSGRKPRRRHGWRDALILTTSLMSTTSFAAAADQCTRLRRARRPIRSIRSA